MTRYTRLALTMAATLAAGMLAGCPPVPTRPPETRPAATPAALPEAPSLGVEPVAKGVFVAIDRRVALTPETLARARMSREAIFSKLQQNVAAAAPGTAPASAPAEAPPEALKYYVEGRSRFVEGANAEAMTLLERALAIDPNGFTVLRLLGRTCFAASQLSRGAMYLERAQRIHPADVEVNYLLGRYYLERNDSDKACYYLLVAEDSPEKLASSIYTPLTTFYLGIALQQGGYHLAAAQAYERFIEISERPIAGYRYDVELSYLINMEWASHLAAAENFARIGNFAAALPHYQKAAQARAGDPYISSRLVNALAQRGQADAAERAAMDLVSATRASDEAVKLLAWTYQAAGHEKRLVPDLAAYLRSPGPGKAVASTAEQAMIISATQENLGDRAAAIATLAGYMRGHPTDLEVLRRLTRRVDSPAAFQTALEACAGAIAADRAKVDDVLRMFVPVAEGPYGAAWARGSAATTGTDQRGAAADYLSALAAQSQNAPAAQIEGGYEAALKKAPDFEQARESYVEYLLSRENFARADALIDGAVKQNPGSPKTWELQVQSVVAQQRYVPALQLAQEVRQRFPGNADVRMMVVEVYRLRGQDKEADAELQGIMRDLPKYETSYRVLVNSLLGRSRRDASLIQQVGGALSKLGAAIPDSRFGRIMSAVMLARGGRYDDAENVLRAVLAVDPDDAEALVPLSQVLQLVGRTEQGVALLESSLRRKLQLDVVRGLAGMYKEAGRKGEALALVRRIAEENPDSETYTLLYAAELIAQDKRTDALSVMNRAMQKFPRSQAVAVSLARLQEDSDDTAGAITTMRTFIKANGDTTERYYLLSHFYSAAGNEDASVASLQRVLAIMPDHIAASNDLGYFWINAGIHLDQAETMIRKALENKPNDPAFLDSLGWLYYKQGKFDDARKTLEQALAIPSGDQPEVVQHLGDALYRLGRREEAMERWNQALQVLAGDDHPTAADRKQREYLSKALTEARAGREPSLSPLANEATTKAAVKPGA